jgi:hypothetical protein
MRLRDEEVRLRNEELRIRNEEFRLRNEDVRLRDEAMKLADKSQHAVRHVVFCHIPRTGGSSVWHALAESAASAGVPIIDLYYLSQLNYGSTQFVYNVLADYRDLLKSTRAIIHLHTLHNIGYFLQDENIVYTTVVRDPIERFCSDVFHLHNALLTFTEAARQDFLNKMPWNSDFAAMMIDDTAPLDQLLEAAAEEPFFRFFYYHFFFGILCSKPVPTNQFQPPDGADAIEDLARRVKQRFAYIGRYPDVAGSFHAIAESFGLPHDRSQPFSKHINHSGVNQKIQHSRQRFADTFRTSYQLLESIGISF